MTDENAGVIARICRALDGMPLAIELAAARLRSMTPTQLADRLDDRFALLTAGSRTALPRHQTLRAVVDWSWDLLSDAERAMWRHLSVFTGGATLAAAVAVGDGDDAASASTLDVLTSLVDKSLLAVRDDAPEPRYMMLETIRAYGQLRLDEAGERETARTAHAAYFERLASDASDKLLGAEQLPWLAKLTADHDNLYTAVRYATAAGDGRRAIRLVGSLGWYWWLRGHRSEGVELVKAALALDCDDARLSEPELEERAIAYTIGALLAVDGTKEMSLALEWFDAATAIVERVGRPSTPLLRLVVPLRKGVFETFQSGVPPVDDDVGMPIHDPFPWIAATARIMRAHVLLNFGRALERADDDFRAALAVYRQLGERWGTAFSLVSLGGLAAWRGDFRTAIEDLDEALCCVTEMGAWEDRVAFRVLLARLLWADGDRDRAYASLAAAERDAQRLGVPEAQANVSVAASDVARLDGDLFLALDHLRRAERFAAHDTVASQLRAIVASSRGYLASAQGDVDEARRWHRAAVDYAISPVDAPVIAQVLVGLAEIALLEGEPGSAATILGASAAVRGTEDLSPDGRPASDLGRACGTRRRALRRGVPAGSGDHDEADRRTRRDRPPGADRDTAQLLTRPIGAAGPSTYQRRGAGSSTDPAPAPECFTPSGAAFERADREWREHHGKAERPQQRLQCRCGNGSGHEQPTDRVGQDGHRIHVRPRLQPAGHRGGRHECVGREREREQHDEPEDLHLLRARDDHADQHDRPRDRERGDQHETERAEHAEHVRSDRNPSRAPTPSSIATDHACLTRSATIRPASGEKRAIGNARSRSKNPFSRSVDSPTPVFSVVNNEFCTMMPASANVRYSCGDPEIAPPKTYVNSSRNMTGCTLKSISSNGLCLICTNVRQANDMVWRRPCSGVMRADSLVTLAWPGFVGAGAGRSWWQSCSAPFEFAVLRWW